MTGDLTLVPELVNQARVRLTEVEQALAGRHFDVSLEGLKRVEEIARWARYVIEARR